MNSLLPDILRSCRCLLPPREDPTGKMSALSPRQSTDTNISGDLLPNPCHCWLRWSVADLLHHWVSTWGRWKLVDAVPRNRRQLELLLGTTLKSRHPLYLHSFHYVMGKYSRLYTYQVLHKRNWSPSALLHNDSFCEGNKVCFNPWAKKPGFVFWGNLWVGCPRALAWILPLADRGGAAELGKHWDGSGGG